MTRDKNLEAENVTVKHMTWMLFTFMRWLVHR